MFKVAPALKTYFGYNETTTYLSRSFYTNDKWEDIIYHELASNRPVIYGGQSTGGGHAFCATAIDMNTPPISSISTGVGVERATSITCCQFLILTLDKALEAAARMAVSTSDRKPSSAFRNRQTTERQLTSHPP